MTNFPQSEIFANRAKAVNVLNSNINKLAPKLLDFVKTCKVKNDNTLHAKSKVDFKSVLESLKIPKNCVFYLDINDFSICLRARTSYPSSACSCEYYEDYIYLYNRKTLELFDVEPLATNKSAVKYLQSLAKAQKLQSNIREMENTLNRLKSEIGARFI